MSGVRGAGRLAARCGGERTRNKRKTYPRIEHKFGLCPANEDRDGDQVVKVLEWHWGHGASEYERLGTRGSSHRKTTQTRARERPGGGDQPVRRQRSNDVGRERTRRLELTPELLSELEASTRSGFRSSESGGDREQGHDRIAGGLGPWGGTGPLPLRELQ